MRSRRAPPHETISQTAAWLRHDAIRHDRPAGQDEIPSPQAVTAWLTFQTLPAERIRFGLRTGSPPEIADAIAWQDRA